MFLWIITVLFIGIGCATVSPEAKPVESRVSQEEQIGAQKTAGVPEEKSYKRKVAIGRFTNETNYGRALLTDDDFNRIGKQASDMLASRLVRSDKFIVFERPDINKIEQEQGLLDDAQMVGVDVLIVGSVTEFGRSVKGKQGFLSSTKLQAANAKVEIRLVDVRTGQAIFSAAGSGEATTESGEVAGFGSRAAYDASLNDRAIGAAISDMLDDLIFHLDERPWKTDILAIENGQVYISGGTNQGLQKGDLLDVMTAGRKVKSQQTGMEISLPSEKVAQLRVLEFFGESEVNEGSLCEVVSGQIDAEMIKQYYVTEIN